MTKQKQSNLEHVIARRQAAHHIELCEFVNMSLRAERRNRNIGEIRRLCDYDVAIAPRNDSIQSHGVSRHCEERILTSAPCGVSHPARPNEQNHAFASCQNPRQRSDEAIHSIDCCVGLRPPRNDAYRNDNPPTLTLPLKGGREQLDGNSGTPQSLLSSNHFTHLTHLTHFTHLRKRCAFTLAEVLVTLAVIGIVAVMTIPNMVSNYQKKAWDTASTVFDKKLTEALKVMNVQGTLAGYSSTEDFVTELSKHLKITKTCTNSNLTACFNDKVMWGKDDKSELTEVDISKLKTAKDFGQEDWNTNIVGFQLASGVTGLMAYNPECKQDEYSNQVNVKNCLAVLYDVQGYSKPNTSSKDLRHQNVLALGNTKTCDVEFDNHCWTISKADTPMTFAECTGGDGSPNTETPAGAEAKKLGINNCYFENDYWAGAVKKCGGTSKMPSMQQLADLASEIYGKEGMEAKKSYNGLAIANKELFDTFLVKSSYAHDTFYVWSDEEISRSLVYYHCFADDFSSYSSSGVRNTSYRLAVCLSD